MKQFKDILVTLILHKAKTMDLKQQKLGKSEWESIEVSVDDDEKEILLLIVKGYNDVNIR